MKNKRKLIGLKFLVRQRLSERFKVKIKKRKKIGLVLVEIRESKKYGATADIIDFSGRSITDYIFKEGFSKKASKKLARSLDKIDKPVDTSKWVKPDEESIRNDLIVSLFMLEILNKEDSEWDYYKGRSDVCFSILHEHSPKNPQSLHVGYLEPYFMIVLTEKKIPLGNKLFEDWFKRIKTRKKLKKSFNQIRKEHKIFEEKILDNMIKIKRQ